MKFKSLIIPLTMVALLSVGCSKNDKSGNTNENTPSVTENNGGATNNNGTNTNNGTGENKADMVTSPSRVTDEANLFRAIGESWIVILENDVNTTKEVVLDTGFKKADKDDSSKMVPSSRVLALYKNGENKVKEASYTLTTPKLTIKDENAKIEGGVVKGDVYIEANGVTLEDATIDGNVYFKNEEAKNTFHMDEKSKVAGTMEVK
ncbi:lipofamily protein [Clostridium sp. 1001275B_160808_H3]|uniref:lipofamily protein n=1 Tax=Clostridium sp. 1001275B_160808_H3 TaxID=2787110 RepID=UPI00189716DF|nr:lipofamily protein [Clostridium sp. 1001275B_160808_H3]